jgi:DUF4097 and DUF4098 domain-containing protein YvlB
MGAMNPDSRTMTFETPAPTRLRVSIPSGRISVTAEDTAVTRIELVAVRGGAARDWVAEAEIVQEGDEIVVRGRRQGFGMFGQFGSIEATVRAPRASDATLSVGAGRIETTGPLRKVSANTGAGDIHVADCGEADAHTGSGNIEIDFVAGSVEAKTGSGEVKVGQVGADARISTASGNARVEGVAGAANLTTAHGNIEVGAAGDSLEAFTASGNVRVRRADHGHVRARTVSGGVSVGVAGGVAALLDLSTVSGRVRSDLAASGPPAESEAHVELVLSTVSGNVEVARA